MQINQKNKMQIYAQNLSNSNWVLEQFSDTTIKSKYLTAAQAQAGLLPDRDCHTVLQEQHSWPRDTDSCWKPKALLCSHSSLLSHTHSFPKHLLHNSHSTISWLSSKTDEIRIHRIARKGTKSSFIRFDTEVSNKKEASFKYIHLNLDSLFLP